MKDEENNVDNASSVDESKDTTIKTEDDAMDVEEVKEFNDEVKVKAESTDETPQKPNNDATPSEEKPSNDVDIKTEENPENDNNIDSEYDPLLIPPSNTVRESDHVILMFGDGRQIFAQCLKHWKGKSAPMKINKRSYPTANLVGLPYGTVLELDHTRGGLFPLPDGQDILPDTKDALNALSQQGAENGDGNSPTVQSSEGEDGTTTTTTNDPTSENVKSASNAELNTTLDTDNRNLDDDNTSQTLTQQCLQTMRDKDKMHGSTIVQRIIENSSTFHTKTQFSQHKYVQRKQKKYQPRCRLTRCLGPSITEALFLKNPRQVMNLREDTLGQILSYANVYAGAQVLVMESCMGVITGSVAQRMGGYGKALSVYTAQQPPWNDMIKRFNLSFGEHHSIKWIHSGEVFGDMSKEMKQIDEANRTALKDGKEIPPAQAESTEVDTEVKEREELQWPCPLQDHTREYITNFSTTRDQKDFLSKRCNRFARKLTRHSTMEAKSWLMRQSDSLIVASKYDPTETVLELLPYLTASGPIVVFCEFLEPLVECFRELQKLNLAINLRLSDTWLREYQVLPGRTHPNMNMSQSGGFLLTGTKLCPVTGQNELEENVLKDLRAQLGGRRGKKKNNRNNDGAGGKKGKANGGGGGGANKRARFSS